MGALYSQLAYAMARMWIHCNCLGNVIYLSGRATCVGLKSYATFSKRIEIENYFPSETNLAVNWIIKHNYFIQSAICSKLADFWMWTLCEESPSFFWSFFFLLRLDRIAHPSSSKASWTLFIKSSAHPWCNALWRQSSAILPKSRLLQMAVPAVSFDPPSGFASTEKSPI